MPLNEVAKNPCFRGLTCPYTGKPVTVRVIAAGKDMPMYFSPDAYDPSEIQTTPAKVLEKAGTRNGVSGSMSGGNELVCPYTGNRMTIMAMPDKSGYWLSGGFSPSTPQRDPYAFAAGMSMRGGVPADMPASRGKVYFPTDRAPTASAKDPAPKDFALAYSDKVIHDALPSKIAVTVSKKAPKKRQ